MPQDFTGSRKLALWLLLGAQLAATVIHWQSGALVADLTLTAAIAALVATGSKAGRLHVAASATVLLLWLIDLSHAAFLQPDAALAPELVLLRIFGPLGVLLVGFGFGNWLCVAATLTLGAFILSHPTDDGREIAQRSNLFFGICTGHALVLAYQRTFHTLYWRLTQQGQTLSARVSERARLVEALGDDLTGSIGALETELAEESPRVSLLSAAHDRLSQALGRAQATLDPTIAPAPAAADALNELRDRMTRWLLWSFAIFTGFIALRIVWTGAGPLLTTCLLLGMYGVGIVVLAKRPDQRRTVVVVLTVLSLMAIVAALAHWGLRTPPPNLVYLPGLAYIGICVSSPRLSMGLFAFCLLVIGGVALAGGGAQPLHMQLLLDCALVTSVYQVGWYLMEQRVGQTLTELERRARELSELETFRTRVCGTLFHDVANPAQVLGMLIDVAGSALKTSDLVRARRLLTRLSLLVRAALSVLSGRDARSAPELDSVSLSTMFEELEELFAHRLAAKQQTLRFTTGSELAVLAAPELLRDSVLANLISNAIKFSEPGAAIEIVASSSEGQVEIAVRDRGPGFSGELIERLAEGVRPLSTPGSAGEKGLGLGLTLASEHLRSMGGRLTLRRVSQGGEAAVRLPRCDAEQGRAAG